MTSLDHSKHSAAAPSTARPAAAQPGDLPALAAALSASLGQRFEAGAARRASAELDYGCVDWFIYGADARVGPASLTG